MICHRIDFIPYAFTSTYERMSRIHGCDGALCSWGWVVKTVVDETAATDVRN